MKTPRVTGEKVLKALKHLGFSCVHVRGSHHYLYNPDKKVLVTVPVHSGRILAVKTLSSIMDTAQVSIEELMEYLG